VYCLGDDVSADDILAPEYLSFDLDEPEERRWLGAYALAQFADRCGHFVELGAFRSPYSILVAGRRFGHGSARVHSSIALSEAGVRCVVAGSFATEFMRPAVNGGFLQCVTFANPGEVDWIETGSEAIVDLDQSVLMIGDERIVLAPAGVTRDIVQAGGLPAYLKSGRDPLE
jgi:3-isopropylmalate/(R)-2-methylmalate dehydratase small subunit